MYLPNEKGVMVEYALITRFRIPGSKRWYLALMPTDYPQGGVRTKDLVIVYARYNRGNPVLVTDPVEYVKVVRACNELLKAEQDPMLISDDEVEKEETNNG